MKKYSETSLISDLINSTVFGEIAKSDKMNLIIKQSTLFSFWEEIVGKKFAKYTKPTVIKSNKLYICAKSPALIQELSFLKDKLIKKVNSYSMPLGIEIKDFVFDYKNYNDDILDDSSDFIEDKPIQISQQEVDKIELDAKTEASIQKNIEKINFLNDEQKDAFLKKILNTYKVKRLQDK